MSALFRRVKISITSSPIGIFSVLKWFDETIIPTHHDNLICFTINNSHVTMWVSSISMKFSVQDPKIKWRFASFFPSRRMVIHFKRISCWRFHGDGISDTNRRSRLKCLHFTVFVKQSNGVTTIQFFLHVSGIFFHSVKYERIISPRPRHG